ncbi:MAG: hypothetical protein M1837_001087 [Sclerophora amabilis]|nr:MAG: hypothetical protein M1837_001087 [Sclerophora amabilis]
MEALRKRPWLHAAQGANDQDLELRQARLTNDSHLKSVFEGIFEKYGKDFTGVGDEIDLQTGAIVVDNGHLQEMQDEQDVGEATGLHMMATSEESEGLFSEEGSSDVDDTEHQQENGETYSAVFLQQTAPSDTSEDLVELPKGYSGQGNENRSESLPESSPTRQTLPSETSIIEHFGQDIGPQIFQYVSQLQPVNESDVEPAWRTAGPAPPIAKKRPILRTLLQPTERRSRRSQGGSLWAPQKRLRQQEQEIEHSTLDGVETDACSDTPRGSASTITERPPSTVIEISSDEDEGDGLTSRTREVHAQSEKPLRLNDQQTDRTTPPKCNPIRHYRKCTAAKYCENCDIKETITFRYLEGQRLCNACGLYLMKYGMTRPAAQMRPFRSRPKRKRKPAAQDCVGNNHNTTPGENPLVNGLETRGSTMKSNNHVFGSARKFLSDVSSRCELPGLLQLLLEDNIDSSTIIEACQSHTGKPLDDSCSPKESAWLEDLSKCVEWPNANNTETKPLSSEGLSELQATESPLESTDPPLADESRMPEPSGIAVESSAYDGVQMEKMTPRFSPFSRRSKPSLVPVDDNTSEDELMTPTRPVIAKFDKPISTSRKRKRCVGGPHLPKDVSQRMNS